MGGNCHGVGNVTKCAEFNFWYDPEAASIVLKEVKCPLHIIPWETCLNAGLGMSHSEWRFGVLNSVPSDIMTLMDKIEENVHYQNSFIPADAFVVACFCLPQIIKMVKQYQVSVELNGRETRGQMVLERRNNENLNAFVVEEIDVEIFKQFLCWACGHDITGLFKSIY